MDQTRWRFLLRLWPILHETQLLLLILKNSIDGDKKLEASILE